VVFFKLTTAIVGPGEPIVLPVNSTQPDYEAEFAFVIGHGGFRFLRTSGEARLRLHHRQRRQRPRRPIRLDAVVAVKSFPPSARSAPPSSPPMRSPTRTCLQISLSIDGEQLQNSNTRELVFKIPELIEYLSSITPLLGDIVSTGTPPAWAWAATPSAGSSLAKPSPSRDGGRVGIAYESGSGGIVRGN
jgi:2-keto-4-pentenoate hydratase/2-oxohepta-3-ene-1,7-dioic acid hydratase in catechol pathway